MYHLYITHSDRDVLNTRHLCNGTSNTVIVQIGH